MLRREELKKFNRATRGHGVRVGLANGAFDLLHVGHIRYLQAAADACDVLVVAVNSDVSVKLSKGPERPLIPQDERAEMVCALSGVDAVHIFDEQTVSDVIRELEPTFHFKGTDYSAASVPEASLVQSLGGQVVIVGDPKHHSTTDTVKKLSKV